VFNCRTKLEKLLCLKYFGSSSWAKSGGFQTTKLLFPLLQDTTASVAGSSTMSYVFVRKGGGAVLCSPSKGCGADKLWLPETEDVGTTSDLTKFRSCPMLSSNGGQWGSVFTTCDTISPSRRYVQHSLTYPSVPSRNPLLHHKRKNLTLVNNRKILKSLQLRHHRDTAPRSYLTKENEPVQNPVKLLPPPRTCAKSSLKRLQPSATCPAIHRRSHKQLHLQKAPLQPPPVHNAAKETHRVVTTPNDKHHRRQLQ
jgi:hypothetical protein